MGGRDDLARRYRRLLGAYPRAYRRERGPEMVTTMLDAAPPDQTRPTRAESVDLLAGGIRYRLRVHGKTAIFMALCAAVFGTVAGGALGDWLGWHTAPPLPSNEVAARLAAPAFPPGTPVPAPAERHAYLFGSDYDDSGTWLAALLGTDEYHEGHVTFHFRQPPGTPKRAVVDAARARMRDAGWHVGATEGHLWGANSVAYRASARIIFRAEEYDEDSDRFVVEVTRAVPGAVLPLTALGLLCGGLTGWLLLAWGVRRARSNSPVWFALAMLCNGAGMFALLLPTLYSGVAVVVGAAQVQEPIPIWIGYSTIGLRLLTVFAALAFAAALLVTALPRPPRPSRHLTPG